MSTERISTSTGGWMIISAALIDFIQFLLVLIPFIGWALGWLASVIASFMFGMWFSHHDVSLMSSKRILGFLGTLLGEWVPFINAAPLWTCLVAFTVVSEWRRPDEI